MFDSKEDKLKNIRLEMIEVKKDTSEAKKLLADRREMGDTAGVAKYEKRVQELIRKHGELNSERIQLQKELGVKSNKEEDYKDDED